MFETFTYNMRTQSHLLCNTYQRVGINCIYYNFSLSFYPTNIYFRTKKGNCGE